MIINEIEVSYRLIMFRKLEIPLRKFICELKHRPPEDHSTDNEELIDTIEVYVPKLKDAVMEKQWVVTLLWNKLEDKDYKEKGINQIFIFTANFDLVVRLESNHFEDEPCTKLDMPETNGFDAWQRKVENKFKSIYGISIDQWQSMT